MPAASNRAELVSVTKREFAKLSRLLDTVDEIRAQRPCPTGETICEIVAQRAHWIALFFTWVEDGRAGRPVQTPAPGYAWSDLMAFRSALRQEQANLGWVGVRERLLEQQRRLMAFFEAESDDSLYTPGLYPWMKDWTLGRWAEAAGASHYSSATRFVRACLQADQDASALSSDNSNSRNRSNASRLTGSN